MSCRIAVITDSHYAPNHRVGNRRCDLADILLLRTIHRLNRFVKPDVVLLLGDLIDEPESADADKLYADLLDALGLLTCPWLAIPGNHDVPPSRFYQHFPHHQTLDAAGVRFVTFDDAEEPGWNASRSPEDLARMATMRGDHDGPLVTVQHVPVLPPGTHDSPYGYLNTGDVIDAMEAARVTLSLSGHFHPGTSLIEHNGIAYQGVPALCESPFHFAVVNIDDNHKVSVEPMTHQLPPELGLYDFHSHTQFAYCQENMHMLRSPQFAEAFGLAGIAFTEHSGHLYFDRHAYWGGDVFRGGINGQKGRDRRVDAYWDAIAEFPSNNSIAGLEVDADFSGQAVIEPADKARSAVLNGAIHWLPTTYADNKCSKQMATEFLDVLSAFAKTGIQILAHPFRVFRRERLEVPESLFEPTIAILKEYDVAAEINFHTNEPNPAFFRQCIDAGVPITLGSDAHNLYEVGEFHPHLDLLRSIGVDSNVNEVLLPPKRITGKD